MTVFHQVAISLAFGTERTEDELWSLLGRLGERSPAAQLHHASDWLDQGLETEENWDAGLYTAAVIVVGKAADEEEDMFDAGRRLTEEVVALFNDSIVEKIELMNMDLGNPENEAHAGGRL